MTYNRFDIILVRFPFTERRGQKQRPAAVLTNSAFNDSHGHAIAAMITTASNTVWPSDLPITAFSYAGLRSPSVVRMKLFTVAEGLIIGRMGTLSPGDQQSLSRAVQSLLFQ